MATRVRSIAPRVVVMAPLVVLLACAPSAEVDPAKAEPGPRSQSGATMTIYEPQQHPLYDGNFNVRGGGIYQVGTLKDESPWDHMGDDGANVRKVGGSVVFEVNEIDNTGVFRADLELPEGRFVIELDHFQESSSCQDGGIAAFIYAPRAIPRTSTCLTSSVRAGRSRRTGSTTCTRTTRG